MAEQSPNEAEELEASESTDEDHLGVDPLEGGMDLGEQDGYQEADHYGMTAHEQATPRSLDSRLAEEQTDKPGTSPAVDAGQVPLADSEGGYSPGGEAGYDSGYSDGNKGFVVTEPDEPAADETVTSRQW